MDDELQSDELDLKAVKKSEGDGEHPASHYLVVEDSKKPSTWHLRVRNAAGKLDHRLMGAAWAALHGGYRGSKYAGPNKSEALSKLKTLYEQEDMPVPQTKDKDYYEGPQLVSYIPFGATSFGDVDEYIIAQATTERVQELTRQFKSLAENILYSDEIADKGKALRDLVDELDKRLGEAVKSKGVASVFKDALITWLGSHEYNPPGLSRIKERIARDREEHLAPSTAFMVWKEADQHRWLATYSNKYRDQDVPSEIISADAHKDFVAAVDTKQTPMPELWHFHVPGSRWGVADMLAFDEQTGFVIASGTIDKGHEREAEIIAEMGDVRVSHGMLRKSLEYDTADDTVITRYRSIEISDLPAEYAANPLTDFQVLKEGGDMIPEHKKAYLKKVGLSDDKIKQLESDLARKATEAKEQGLEFKEAETVEATVKAAESELTAAAPAEAEVIPAALTIESIADAVGAAVKPVIDPLVTRIEALEAQAKERTEKERTEEQRIVEKAQHVPAASLSAMIMRNLGVRTSSDAVVKEGEAFTTPPETKGDATRTGIRFLDAMLSEPKQS